MEKNTTAEIALKVAAAIGRSAYSQRAVAKEAGIASTTFDRRLRGQSDFYIVELISIARILDLSLEDFLPTGTPLNSKLAA